MDDPARARPKRSLGQNFLVDGNLQRKIVEAVDPGPDDTVLEIGPGRGALTAHLVGRVARLVLVELDDDLAAALETEYGGRPDVEVLHRDVLEVSLTDVAPEPGRLKVVGNIPYNITTPILFHLLERPRPAEVVLMVQEEVADRILAEPGTRAYGALAVGVRAVAAVERVARVTRKAFRPVPRVDSAVIRLRPHAPPPLDLREEHRLRTLTRALFQWRRKQLQKTLRDHPDLGLDRGALAGVAREGGFDLRARPQTLAPDDLVRLAAHLAEAGWSPG